MKLERKRILVIGGGSGIGLAAAAAAIGEGAHVVLASTNAEKLTLAAEQLGESASSAVLDVSDESAVARFFADSGRFDHIVFTAGDWIGFGPSPIADLDLAASAKLLNVRFWGAVAVAKHGATKLPPNGSFTITGGMLAHQPRKGMALATAGAGAIESLARGLAVDLAPVRVNCVCPGLIWTETWAAFPEEYRASLTKATEGQLVPRPGLPAETAEAYLYLMRNDYATGQVLYVEGGSSLAR